jgi:class 3 adenylate cyclase
MLWSRVRSDHDRTIGDIAEAPPWRVRVEASGDAAVDIAAWLCGLGLERYVQTFRDHEIDAEVLCDLTEGDLEKLAIPLGPRKKLLRAIAALTSAAPEPVVAGEPERRQLTVMFCDLVGSTELSARLDPEDLRDLIRGYQDACTGMIVHYEGYIARFVGDGLLAYFGWPRGYEDNAERAVRAGLELVASVSRLKTLDGAPLSCRVGIATGEVVVRDLISDGVGRKDSVVGETPNLAARLQALAAPGSVVISSTTHRLLGRLFNIADLGTHTLKGFAKPVQAWQVTGESRVESRFEALHDAAHSAPLVNREEESEVLLRLWVRAKGGQGQVVLLSGEPGIGKSRLVQALFEQVSDEAHIRLRHFCSPSTSTARCIPYSSTSGARQVSRTMSLPRPSWTSWKRCLVAAPSTSPKRQRSSHRYSVFLRVTAIRRSTRIRSGRSGGHGNCCWSRSIVSAESSRYSRCTRTFNGSIRRASTFSAWWLTGCMRCGS